MDRAAIESSIAMKEMTDKWYADWQSDEHSRLFDFPSTLSARNLARHLESLNDIRLLNESLKRFGGGGTLLEVGCATGELYRYLGHRWPALEYYGVDISRPAIARARSKYPGARFSAIEATPDSGLVEAANMTSNPHLLYAKDVVHHQTDPLGFLSTLLDTASDGIVLRIRTRDVGGTVFEHENSCQYHYGGWMPYIVLNIDEFVEHVRSLNPDVEIVAHRHRILLGGEYKRYLPKDCYLEETGTAETSVAIFLKSQSAGRVRIEDRYEDPPNYTVPHMFAGAVRLARSRLFGNSGRLS